MSLRLTLKNVAQSHICERCHQQFQTPLHLKHHKSRVHSAYRPYVCGICHKSFRRINYLQQHSQRHHDDDRPYVCTVCDESFKSRSLLKGHQRSHIHFEGHHECGYCGASFLHLAEARLHVLLVHDDPSVLPPDRPRREFRSKSLSVNDDVFCVKEGQGLKIKLKRKLSTDGQCEQSTEDFNPGSHTSDSGKGNSDMDEEDVLRNGNQLLKMPTLVVKHNDQTITTTQHKLNLDSGLLMKPKLELEQTQWGGSKIQPRLDSSDFLSKTNFASSFNLNNKLVGSSFGSKLTPPRATFGSPSHSTSFSSSLTNGSCFSMTSTDLKPAAFQSPPHSSPNLSNSTGGLFNSKPSLLTNPTIGFASGIGGFNSKPLSSGFLSNGSMNGFKAPVLFQKSTAPSKFGQSTGFGSKPQSGLFGTTATSSFGQKTSTFGMSKFGVPPSMKAMSAAPFQPLQSRRRNGEVGAEPVFGSREKVRNTVATKEEKVKPTSAFEQYANSSSGPTTSNPFADAMRKAKNPSPRRVDSDYSLDSESSSYYSEDETGESDDVSDEDVDVSLGDETEPMALDTARPSASDDAISVPGEVGSTPLQPWVSPNLWHGMASLPKSPLKGLSSPTKSLASPKFNHIHEQTGGLFETLSRSPTRKRKSSKTQSASDTTSVPGSPAAPSLQPVSPASVAFSKKSKKTNELPESPAHHHKLRRGSRSTSSANSIISPEHLASKTPVHASPAHQPNGDITIGQTPPTEVSGHIDLDKPSLSLSIPKVLLQPMDHKRASKTRGRPKRTSARTPNPYAVTPSYPAATPAYNLHTPQHSSATPSYGAQTPAYFAPPTPFYPPATPQYHTQTPVHAAATPMHTPAVAAILPPAHVTVPPPHAVTNRYNPRIHAPTKEQMMAKHRKLKKPKAQLGPKSYLQKRGARVRSDSESDILDDGMWFSKAEFLPALSGRTDPLAPNQSSFKNSQKFLCYLRRRACDLILSLFPDLRFGGNFCVESDDVDGLIDYIITCLENQDTSSRCMLSKLSSRKELEVVLCRAGKSAIRNIERKLCKLLKLILPSVSLQMIEQEGIKTLPALIHRVITENIT